MILEKLKSFLTTKDVKLDNDNPEVKDDIETSLSDINIGFFDGEAKDSGNYFENSLASKLKNQADLIKEYRNISTYADVQDAIDEVCNEILFTQSNDNLIKIFINEENEKLSNKLNDRWDFIYNKLLNLDKNLYSIVRQLYIDGQLNFYLQYEKNTSKLSKISILKPFYLYYSKTDGKFKYNKSLKQQSDNKLATLFDATNDDTFEFENEELVHIDSKIYDDGIIKSWLDVVVKHANQLKELEDTLVPIRFNRSMSRRVFNVDVSGLSESKVKAAINNIKNEYKYRNFYDPENGAIKKQTRYTSLVENYWFANRSGSKGTTIDVIDEKGQLGELDDIKYIRKKVFRVLSVPTSRILDTDNPQEFDYNNESISREEIKFILYTSRIKGILLEAFIEILKRDVIINNIMSEEEFNDFIISKKIELKFINENMLLTKLKQIEELNKNDIIQQISENIGKIYSWKYVAVNILGMDENTFQERLKEIKKEKTDKLTSFLYEEE